MNSELSARCSETFLKPGRRQPLSHSSLRREDNRIEIILWGNIYENKQYGTIYAHAASVDVDGFVGSIVVDPVKGQSA